jgi:hypothetical protein
VAVNERLEEVYRAARVPLTTPPDGAAPDDDLRDVVARLLDLGPGRTAPPADGEDRDTA